MDLERLKEELRDKGIPAEIIAAVEDCIRRAGDYVRDPFGLTAIFNHCQINPVTAYQLIRLIYSQRWGGFIPPAPQVPFRSIVVSACS